MSKTQFDLQCVVLTFMLLFFAHTTLCQIEPAVKTVIEALHQAVALDDNAAYHAARAAALELDDQEFDALLEALDKTDTWQALAMQGGLRVRRQHSELAAQFDKHLD